MDTKSVFLLFLVAAIAKAIIQEPNEQLQTLEEYLRDNPNKGQEIWTRGQRTNNVICPKYCGGKPPIDKNKKCRKWEPFYEKKGTCQCIVKFECCPDKCPPVKKDKCWGKNEGLTYPLEGKNFCDCDVITCLPCQPLEPPSRICKLDNKNFPIHCFHYDAKKLKNRVTKCYEADCEFKPKRTVLPNCDLTCTKAKPDYDECGQPTHVCVGIKAKDGCPLNTREKSSAALPLGLRCYHHNPQKVPHPEGGKYYDNGKCVDCVRWKYQQIPCKKSVVSCPNRKTSPLDPVCWKRVVSDDDCKCQSVVCERAPERPPTHKFLDGERCPRGYKKITGVSICAYPRDLCFRCRKVRDPVDCDLKVDRIVHDRDAHGCPVKTCQRSSVPKKYCRSSTYYFDRRQKTFECIPKALYCFVFPKNQIEANVHIKPLIEKDIDAFTFDVYYTMTSPTKDPWILSCAHKNKYNALVIGPKDGVLVGSKSLYTRLTPPLNQETHLTIVWNGVTGDIRVFVDGKLERRGKNKAKTGKTGKKVLKGCRMILGQEQDEVGGKFDPTQRFVGKLCGFQMWDRVLSEAELKLLFDGRLPKNKNGNLFDSPPSYKYELLKGATKIISYD